MLFLALCSDKEIEVVPFLIERWNAKRMASIDKVRKEIDKSLLEKEKEQENIQNNVTNILLRYFKKIEDVSKGLEFYAVPFDIDNNLHIMMKENVESRCIAFNELLELVTEYKSQRNNLER